MLPFGIIALPSDDVLPDTESADFRLGAGAKV
jgi:hypothetical protein